MRGPARAVPARRIKEKPLHAFDTHRGQNIEAGRRMTFQTTIRLRARFMQKGALTPVRGADGRVKEWAAHLTFRKGAGSHYYLVTKGKWEHRPGSSNDYGTSVMYGHVVTK